MKRSQFLASLLGVVAAPFVAKEVLAKEETGTGLLHQIKNNPSILSDDEMPFKDFGIMIPEGNGNCKLLKSDGTISFYHKGKEYYYSKSMADTIERFELEQDLLMLKTFRLR